MNTINPPPTDPCLKFLKDTLLSHGSHFLVDVLGNKLIKKAVSVSHFPKIADTDDSLEIKKFIEDVCIEQIKTSGLIKHKEHLLKFCEQLIMFIVNEFFDYNEFLALALNETTFTSRPPKKKSYKSSSTDEKFDIKQYDGKKMIEQVSEILKLTTALKKLSISQTLYLELQAEEERQKKKLLSIYSPDRMLKHKTSRKKTSIEDTTEPTKKMNRPIENEVARRVHRCIKSLLGVDCFTQVADITNIIVRSEEYTDDIVRHLVKNKY